MRPLGSILQLGTLVTLLFGLTAPAPALARKPKTEIPLTFSPTSEASAPLAVPTPEMRAVPGAVVISDERVDSKLIGTRTDDNDRRSDLKATTDVATFVQDSLARQARDWGFPIGGGGEAAVVWVGKLTKFWLEESNQAVGASYTGEVVIEAELRDRQGNRLWGADCFGDATRYGKKFSIQNANETLSDALAEALSTALNDPSLRSAWGRRPGASAEPPPAPLSPEALLEEVRARLSRGATEAELVDHLKRQTLERPLGADDLAAWRGAGLPEALIRAAMTLPVRQEP
jgi:hypothetical protein